MKTVRNFFALAYVCLIAVSTATAEWAYVSRVIDGDTFETSEGIHIRILGIDTPESVHPKMAKEAGSDEATQLAITTLQNQLVWLEGSAKDVYGRRLAKVKTRDGVLYADVVKEAGLDKKSRRVVVRQSNNLEKPLSDQQVETERPPKPTDAERVIWIESYTRKDGIQVSGHWRRLASRTKETAALARPEPPTEIKEETANEDKIYVSGYYRKDGTYVKPYYRSKPKR